VSQSAEILLLCPILVPFLTGVLALFFWNNRRLQRLISVLGMAATLAAALFLMRTVSSTGIQVLQVGNWPAPFGITIVADLLSAVMVSLAAMMGLAVTVYSLAGMDAQRESFGYYPILNVLVMGICGSFLTGDIFNLYVWFEVMLIASFCLIALGGERAQLEGAIKYITLNLISSAIFLAAVGILYRVVGTLNMADIAVRIQSAPGGPATTLSIMFLVAFGIKAAVFPMFFWLPASYHTPPAVVSAIFAGLLTKVGIYALIRMFTLIYPEGAVHVLIMVIAGFTLVCGGLGAIVQEELRRILSFNIISHIGFMIMGLGLMDAGHAIGKLALTGTVLYLIHDIIVKTNLFLVSGVIQRLQGSGRLSSLGGLYHARPLLALLFMIPALSLAGVPPLSGFWPKLMLVRAGLEAGRYLIVAAALVASILTLYSVVIIWEQVFWKDKPESRVFDRSPISDPLPRSAWLAYLLPVAALALCTLAIGFWVEPFSVLSERAADQLLDPRGYIDAILPNLTEPGPAGLKGAP